MIKLLKNRKKIISKAIDSFLPHIATVPFKQECFDDCHLIVSKGDYVKEGQVIARDSNIIHHPYAAEIHAPIPGIIGDTCVVTLPNGETGEAVQIKLAGSFSYRGKKENSYNWRISDTEILIKQLARSGVINTFFINKPSSLASQIKNRRAGVSSVFIVRLFDEDPYRCTDSFLTLTQFDKIRKGAAILKYIMGSTGIIFAYDKSQNSPENKEADGKCFEGAEVKYIGVDCNTYPSGHQRELISEIVKDCHGTNLSNINIHNLLVDAVTLLHVYEAVELQQPVTSQYVHITGNCLKATGVFRIPLGISLDFLAEQCGGFIKKPNKIIINGQLTGWGIIEQKVPVTKYVKSIAFVSTVSLPLITPQECILCGKCRSVCPAGLCPDILYNAMIDGMASVDAVYLKASTLCSCCTLCNAVCSSRLPLSQTIELLKEKSYEKLFDK